MSTVAYRANDTTVYFDGTAIPRVIAVRPGRSAAKIDTTVLGEDNNTYEAGTTDYDVGIDVLGYSGITIGDKGALSIVFNGGNISLTNAQCFESSFDLGLNQAVKTAMKFYPVRADSTS